MCGESPGVKVSLLRSCRHDFIILRRKCYNPIGHIKSARDLAYHLCTLCERKKRATHPVETKSSEVKNKTASWSAEQRKGRRDRRSAHHGRRRADAAAALPDRNGDDGGRLCVAIRRVIRPHYRSRDTLVLPRPHNRLARLFAGEGLLAHWTVDALQVQKQATPELAETRERNRGLFWITAILFVVIGIPVLVVPTWRDLLRGDSIAVAIVGCYFAVVPLLGLFAWGMPRLAYRRAVQAGAEVYIGQDGVFVNGALHTWKQPFTNLRRVRFKRQAKPPVLEFDIRTLTRLGVVHFKTYTVTVSASRARGASRKRGAFFCRAVKRTSEHAGPQGLSWVMARSAYGLDAGAGRAVLFSPVFNRCYTTSQQHHRATLSPQASSPTSNGLKLPPPLHRRIRPKAKTTKTNPAGRGATWARQKLRMTTSRLTRR